MAPRAVDRRTLTARPGAQTRSHERGGICHLWSVDKWWVIGGMVQVAGHKHARRVMSRTKPRRFREVSPIPNRSKIACSNTRVGRKNSPPMMQEKRQPRATAGSMASREWMIKQHHTHTSTNTCSEQVWHGRLKGFLAGEPVYRVQWRRSKDLAILVAPAASLGGPLRATPHPRRFARSRMSPPRSAVIDVTTPLRVDE